MTLEKSAALAGDHQGGDVANVALAQVILSVVSGPLTGRVFSFDRHDTFIVGRHVNCHACLLHDPKISRHHFILEVNPPAARIRDLGSRNGTFVNGKKTGGRKADEDPHRAAQRIYPCTDLKHGDSVTVGETSIQVAVEAPLLCRSCGEVIQIDRSSQPVNNSDNLCAACRALPDTTAPPSQLSRSEDMDDDDSTGLSRDRASRPKRKIKIAGYKLGKQIGVGAMGVVYTAIRKHDEFPVAIKMMHPAVAVQETARKQFLREVEVLRQLRHPHIVSLLDHGVVDGDFYFVMELCDGGSLDGLLKRRGGVLSLRSAGPIMLACLRALRHAHERNVVHRDIKPQNILLRRRPGGKTPRISDFGLAKSFEQAGLSGMTATGNFGGTYPYMPREQLTDFKYVRPTSDLWSMAATYYQLLTGRFPREFSRGRDPIAVVLTDSPTPIRTHDPNLPKSLAEVIDHALQDEPEKRFQSASEMESAIRNALADQAGE